MDPSPLPASDRAAAGLLLLGALAAAACGGSSPSGGAADRGTSPPAPEVAIPDLQGAGHQSPFRGRRVAATGVVTAVTRSGLYLQDPEGDGRTATSDAVFVLADPAAAAASDRVRVVGTVVEHRPGGPESGNLTTTRLEAEGLEVLEEGATLPSPVRLGSGGRIPPEVEVIGDEELPVDLADPDEAEANPFDPGTEGIDFYESLEGMRVTVAAPVAVSPTEAFDDGTETEVFVLVDGGAHVTPDDARTDRGGLRLQPHPDNRGDQNPERVQLQFEAGLHPGEPPVLAVGDRLGDATGVVGYSYGNFEVRVTGAPAVEPAGLQPETASPGGGTVTVASYNVLNLNPLPGTDARRGRLARHVVRRLGSPDVLALQEIQDANGTLGGEEDTVTDATATLEALARAVAAAGGPRYDVADVPPAAHSSGGVPGGNIRNAFLYRPDRVELTELRSLGPGELTEAGAPDPGAFAGSRAPLAATFEASGRAFTVVNHHGTSRSGSSPVFGAIQPFVQAGEAEREAQALALHAWVRHRLAGDPGARIAVVGDFNTFEFTDDLLRLLPAGGGGEAILENLLLSVPAGRRYTYVYQGNAQALDHAFVTDALRPGARARVVHVNAEFPAARRASDHEPLLVELTLP